jgi:hypothetical protein
VKQLMIDLKARSATPPQAQRRKRHAQPFRIDSADHLLAPTSPTPTTYTREQFKAALRELGLGQRGFAELVGVAPLAVYRWREDGSPFPLWVRLLMAAWLDNKRLRQPLLPFGDLRQDQRQAGDDPSVA